MLSRSASLGSMRWKGGASLFPFEGRPARRGCQYHRSHADRAGGPNRARLAAAEIAAGFVSRKLTPQGRLTAKPMSDRDVALVVRARAAAAGYDPQLFSGHFSRAGFLTEAGRKDANIFKMKDHSRHKSLQMISEYVRDHEAFRDHAGDKFLKLADGTLYKPSLVLIDGTSCHSRRNHVVAARFARECRCVYRCHA